MAKRSFFANAYINSGSYGSPTWDRVACLENYQLNDAWDEVEANSRETPVKESLSTLVGLEITARLKARNSGDDEFDAIMEAYEQRTTLDMLFLDGPIATNGVRGCRFHTEVGSRNRDLGLAAAVYPEVRFKPCADRPADEVPKYVIVAGGVPTYTAFGQAPA